LKPFPAPTQLYYSHRFLTPRQRRERVILLTLAALRPSSKSAGYSLASRLRWAAGAAGTLALLPLRIARARMIAGRLMRFGPMIPAVRSPVPECASTVAEPTESAGVNT
jgi:hypothetical protein